MQKRSYRFPKGGIGLIAWIVGALFLLSLIPILWVSRYAHPVADDYAYGLMVHQTIQAGGGILDVLAAAAERVKIAYMQWQGTFAAIFVFALTPGAFSENLYFLTTWIMIAALTLSTFYFIETLVVRWLGRRYRYAVLISASVLFLQIQFVPDKQETFFWFNGSSYYTLFYALSLVLTALMVRMILQKERLRPALLIPAVILAVLIGGSNYSTALFTLELFVIISGMLVCYHHRAWLQSVVVTGVLLAALMISMVAPGNAVRAELVTQISPFKAIFYSVFYMATFAGKWTGLPQMVLMAFLAPFLYDLSKKCRWHFRQPLFVCLLAFLLCASQLTPPLYAMGSVGSGRQVDIYYYSYYFMLLFCEFYLCGWFARQGFIDENGAYEVCHRYLLPACMVLAAVFVMGCFQYRIHDMSTPEILVSMINGEPQRYDAEFEELRSALMTSEGDALVWNVEAPAYFLGPELTEDPEDWKNRTIASYYGLDSVIAVPKE